MGQRLVINLKNEEETIANVYYHWGGYTSSAIDLTSTIIRGLKKYSDIADVTFRAVKAIAETGAGFNDDAMHGAKEMFVGVDIPVCNDRNNGLLEVTKNGIDCNMDCAESIVSIYMDDQTVFFDVFADAEYDNIDYMTKELLNIDLNIIREKISDINDSMGDNASMVSCEDFERLAFELCEKAAPKWDGSMDEIDFDKWEEFAKFISSTPCWTCDDGFLNKIV